MRPLELTLVVLVQLSALAAFLRNSRRAWFVVFCALDFGVLLIHGLVEGLHWQMAPAYLGVFFFPSVFAIRKLLYRRILAVLIFLLSVGAVTASTVLPMFALPEPTGSDLIGTQILHLVNPHPRDPGSATGEQGQRELMIQVWYPASPSHAARVPYRIWRETTPMSSYQSVLWTHARWSPPFATGNAPYPVLLLNPCWNGRRTYYTWLVEDLVSRGYVVVGIDHTGNSGPTAFPDGRVTQPDPDPKFDFRTRSVTQILQYGAQQLEVQVEDSRFALDELEKMNQDPSSLYYHHLDLDHVGALGHSFGGGVSAQAALEDSRVVSAVNLDGSLFGQVQQTGLAKPFLFIEEDLTPYTPDQLAHDNEFIVDHALDTGDLEMLKKSNATRLFLHGSTHTSFTDRSLFSPFPNYSGAGSIPPLREYDILRTYVAAFFDQTIRHIPSPLLEQTTSPYPEITVEKYHPANLVQP